MLLMPSGVTDGRGEGSRMRARRLAAITGAVVLAFPVVGCDDTGTSEPDGNSGEQTPTAPPTDDADTDTDG
jgi:hypothetical protein